MSVCREGKYTKYLNYQGNDILTFVAKNDEDNYYKVLQLVRESYPNINGFQCCSDKEEQNNFKSVLYIFYNVWGQPVKSRYIHFDFENEKVVTENGREYKVKKDREYVYKIQKTQIKAIDGIKGFYDHVIESMHVNSPHNSVTHSIIEKLDTQHEKQTA